MTGSVMARGGRRRIISQLLATLSERLLAIAQAEILFNSAGMDCDFEAGTIRQVSSAYLSRVLVATRSERERHC